MKKILLLSFLIFMTVNGLKSQSFQYVSNGPFGIQLSKGPDSTDIALNYIFRDMDADDDPDLILVGFNWDDSLSNPINPSDMIYFMDYQENTGTKFNPEFGERTQFNDAFQFPDGYGFFLTDIVDINQDGLNDFLVSAEVDSLLFQHPMVYKQTTDQSFDMMSCEEWNLETFSPYSLFLPNWVDLDLDGDFDLLMSGYYGTYNEEGEVSAPRYLYAKNKGTTEDPDFIGWYTNPYGLEPDTFPILLTSGDLDLDGDIDLLGWGLNGQQTVLAYYENNPGPDNRPSFNGYIASPFGLPAMDTGEKFFFPSLADIDGDGDLDFFIPVDAGTTFRLDFYENTMCQGNQEMRDITICEGESYFVGEETFTEDGVYTIESVGENGCIDVLLLTLSVIPDQMTELSAGICEGESYLFGNEEYTESGLYELSFVSQSGCDSTVAINLSVYPIYLFNEYVEICEGESYEWQGENYSLSGNYTREYSTLNGCDSLYELELIVHAVSVSYLDEEICEGEMFVIKDEVFTETGEYEVNLKDIFDCDSLLFLNLRVHPEFNRSIDTTLCSGEVFHLGGESFTESGYYEINLFTQEDCDSTLYTTLTFIEIDTTVTQNGSILQAIDLEGYQFQWYDCISGEIIEGATDYFLDVPYSGEFAVKISDENGCMSESGCFSVIASGEDPLNPESSITLSPVPARDQVLVRNQSGQFIDSWELFDLSGQKLLVKKLGTDQILDVSNLPEGLYLVKFKLRDAEIVKELMIIK